VYFVLLDVLADVLVRPCRGTADVLILNSN
jgi:hypothetical protein